MALRDLSENGRWLGCTPVAILAVLLVAGAPACVSSPREPVPRRPNIVILLADDLGYGDTGLYGRRDIPTPNIDSLARKGVLFTSGYVTAAVCSPSRAALMTGRYQQRFGIEFNAGSIARAVTLDVGLPATEITMADLLHRGGYRTGAIGKWHLGINEKFHPNARGFDEFYGYLHSRRIPLASMVDTRAETGVHETDPTHEEAEPEAAPAAPARLLRNDTVVEEPDYLTEVWAREAVAFIERHKSEPFLLYVPFDAPHQPLQAPERYQARFPQITDPARRTFVAMVNALDDAVGRILGKLRDTGLERDTLVVFLSDNGCSAHVSPCSNAPFAGGKFSLEEGGIRVPFAMQWPSTLRAGQVYDAPVSALDLLPTAAARAGVELPKDRRFDGVDLVPFLTGQRVEAPHEFLFWRDGVRGAVRHEQWKLRAGDGHARLFDLQNDPGEQHDLADQQRRLVRRLRRALNAWKEELVPPLFKKIGADP